MVTRLASLFVLGVVYAGALVAIQTVDAQHSRGAIDRQASGLDEEGQRAGQDSSGGRGLRARTATDRVAAGATTSPPDGCLIEAICKDGNCKKNYLVFLTADWCMPCRRMHPAIDELAKEYIIYTIRMEDHPEVVAKLAATGLPTTVVMDNGSEVTRYVGITDKATLTKRLKTRKEQRVDYDFQ